MVKLREQILEAVQRYPGIHERQMERQLGLSSRLASYHLEQLEKQGAVQRVAETGFTRYFASLGAPRWSREDVAFLCLMRRPVALRIVILLASEPGLGRKDLARRLNLALASVSHHLETLHAHGMVTSDRDGRARAYRLADPAATLGRLANFTPIPEDLEPFDRLWRDLFG
jgi:predicted transcriptional regulator